jgi:hypothetical protein
MVEVMPPSMKIRLQRVPGGVAFIDPQTFVAEHERQQQHTENQPEHRVESGLVGLGVHCFLQSPRLKYFSTVLSVNGLHWF